MEHLVDIAQKIGGVPVEFADAKQCLIDHPEFMAQTDDLVVALHFCSQFMHEPREVALIVGFGRSARELNWRDMLVHLDFSSVCWH